MTFDDALDALGSEDAFKIDTPGAAAFACAGPVLDNKCVMTNLEWIIDGQSLTVKYGIRYNIALIHPWYVYAYFALYATSMPALYTLQSNMMYCCCWQYALTLQQLVTHCHFLEPGPEIKTTDVTRFCHNQSHDVAL